MQKIIEDSLPKLMSSSFEETQDWFKTFHALYAEMKTQIKEDKYSSIDSNFGAIFTYELIKRKTDISEFKEIFKEMLNVFDNTKIECLYGRFLSPDNEMGLGQYLKEDRFNNSFSRWDNMAYIFWTLETIDDKRYKILEETTLPYLKEMFLAVDEKNVLAVYGGGVHKFVYQACNNLASLIPIIETVQQNPAYQIEEQGYNHNFLNMLLKDIGSHSYEISEKDNIENFNILNDNIPNFKEIYSNALINTKDNGTKKKEKLIIHLEVFNFLMTVGIDTCAIINNKYLEKYKKLESEKNLDEINASEGLKEYYREKPYRDLVDEVSSSLEVALKKKVSFNFSIDHDGSAMKNYVMLKYLESNIKKGSDVSLTDDDIKYLEKQAEANKEKNSFVNIDIKFDVISKYLQYQKMHNAMPDKPSKSKAKKI
jgi:hypothetical protein